MGDSERFFIVTGGPGSGKSSLIDGLEHQGFARSIEAGRAVIQDQVAIGGAALPWQDRELFAELMLAWDLRSYRIAEQAAGVVFFDRGIPDVLGYLRLCELPMPQHMRNAVDVFRYSRKVFIAPPWPEIFQQDRERKQDFDEAVRTYHALAETYEAHGYELLELPRVPVAERVRFVLDRVGVDSRAGRELY